MRRQENILFIIAIVIISRFTLLPYIFQKSVIKLADAVLVYKMLDIVVGISERQAYEVLDKVCWMDTLYFINKDTLRVQTVFVFFFALFAYM